MRYHYHIREYPRSKIIIVFAETLGDALEQVKTKLGWTNPQWLKSELCKDENCTCRK